MFSSRTLFLCAAIAAVAVLGHKLAQVKFDAPPQCGGACPFGNNNCTNPTCSRCNGPNGFNGVCVAGYACGAQCQSNGDCDQTTNCKLCILGKCSAGCQMNCSQNSDCTATCGQCVESLCQPWSCGNKCVSSTDCPGPCATCANNTCQSQCGGDCLVNSDCPQDACPMCTNGKCASAGTCKATCATNAQCSQNPDCNLCIGGVCAAGCMAACSPTTFCGISTCNRCLNSQCQPWTCGASCNPQKGGCAGNCATCQNGTCVTQCNGICFTNSDCPSTCDTCTNGKCI